MASAKPSGNACRDNCRVRSWCNNHFDPSRRMGGGACLCVDLVDLFAIGPPSDQRCHHGLVRHAGKVTVETPQA